jgi:hypothetical protein
MFACSQAAISERTGVTPAQVAEIVARYYNLQAWSDLVASSLGAAPAHDDGEEWVPFTLPRGLIDDVRRGDDLGSTAPSSAHVRSCGDSDDSGGGSGSDKGSSGSSGSGSVSCGPVLVAPARVRVDGPSSHRYHESVKVHGRETDVGRQHERRAELGKGRAVDDRPTDLASHQLS